MNSDLNVVFKLQLHEGVIPRIYSRGRQIRVISKWVACFCYYFFFFIARLIYFKLQINILFLQVTNFLWADRMHGHSANIFILTRQLVQEHLYRRVDTLVVSACFHKSWGETHKRRGYQRKQWFPVCTWALQAKHDTWTVFFTSTRPIVWGSRFSASLDWKRK